MGGGVHLYDVDMPPFGYGLAGLAHAAGVDGGSAVSVRANAVQRLGNKARSGGLAYAAHASHQEGMGQASALDGVAQGPNHCVLADQLREILRPVFARERSEEHTSELQSLMRISYAVFCLKKNNFTLFHLI